MASPFAEKGARLYRTGDLARWLPDGNGRMPGPGGSPGEDPRISHRTRGNRSDPELAMRAVRQCVVVAREDTSGR